MANQFAAAFDDLYAVQTEVLGAQIVASLTGYVSGKPAILSAIGLDEVFVSGGEAQQGRFSLQMKASDFPAEPPKQTAVTCNGDAQGLALAVIEVSAANGIYNITAGDFAA